MLIALETVWIEVMLISTPNAYLTRGPLKYRRVAHAKRMTPLEDRSRTLHPAGISEGHDHASCELRTFHWLVLGSVRTYPFLEMSPIRASGLAATSGA